MLQLGGGLGSRIWCCTAVCSWSWRWGGFRALRRFGLYGRVRLVPHVGHRLLRLHGCSRLHRCLGLASGLGLNGAVPLVLQDWNDGRIPFYTEPPKRDSGGHAGAAIVQGWSQDFSADEVRSQQLLQCFAK